MRVYVKTQINLQNLSTPIPLRLYSQIENTFSPRETDLFLIEDLVMTPGIDLPFKGTHICIMTLPYSFSLSQAQNQGYIHYASSGETNEMLNQEEIIDTLSLSFFFFQILLYCSRKMVNILGSEFLPFQTRSQKIELCRPIYFVNNVLLGHSHTFIDVYVNGRRHGH